MISRQVVRRFVFTSVAVGVTTEGAQDDQTCRASELPIYEKDVSCRDPDIPVCTPKPTALEYSVGAVRRQVWDVMDVFTKYQKRTEETINRGQEYVTSMFKYLSTDADDNTKMAAVGAGAVTGLVLGLRGGICRKLFYASIGAYGMSAVCYPEETQKYTRLAINEARKNTTIAYNFIFGTSMSLPQLPQLPKLPSSMNEVWEFGSSIGKSASSLILDKSGIEGAGDGEGGADSSAKTEGIAGKN